MKKQQTAAWYGILLVLVATLALSGCSGGGGGTTPGGALDTTAPSAPSSLTASTTSSTSISLNWNASTDDVGVTGYTIYRGGTKIATATNNSYSDTGLSSSATYTYTVSAYDAAGNNSAASNIVSATTSTATLPGNGIIALDAAGTVQSTVTVAGPGGSQLTLYAGTRIAIIGVDGDVQAPASLSNVSLSLVSETGSLPSLPNGITALTQLRIVLTIDGIESSAWFWPTSTDETAVQGLKLAVVVDNQNVNDGTLGMLFAVDSGNAVHVGSSDFTDVGGTVLSAAKSTRGAPLRTLTASGSLLTQFNPNRTGSYSVGGSTPGTGSASPPADAFWSSFTVADPGCLVDIVDINGNQICGPSRVKDIVITEESTGDALASCNFGVFGEINIATSGQLPPGFQFWCEKSPGASGGTEEIKIYSTVANLPFIKASLVRASDGFPMWHNVNVWPTGGLHGPDGTIYADPYQQKDFKFAGRKVLTFTINTKMKYDYQFFNMHAIQPFQAAGYLAVNKGTTGASPGFIGKVDVVDTLDSRVLLEENVIKKENIWIVRKDQNATRGNRGTYDYTPKYTGTAKATMYYPLFAGLKVWEASADVTFEKDPAISVPGLDFLDFYNTSTGTLTMTMYTYPDPTGMCYGVPASFTDTYPIFPGDGTLTLLRNSQPLQYRVYASMTSSTPVQVHYYQLCCSWRNPACEDSTLDISKQVQEWLNAGDSDTPALSDGTLQGTYQDGTNYGPFYEWSLMPMN